MSNFLMAEPKCVLIHIPKTAGTSIRRGFFNNNFSKPAFGYIPTEWEPYFKFTFVRNPFDRLISAWKMFTEGTSELDNTGFSPLSLSQFLDIVENDTIIYDERRRTYEERIRHHTIPQTHDFNCLNFADYIGRYENLEEDFKKICAKIGVEYSPLPKRHVTKRTKDYASYFDKETKARASQIYANDLKQLGYKF